MNFNLDHIIVNIQFENNCIRLKTNNENWLIPNQTIEETKYILEKNYQIVKNYFLPKVGSKITHEDLENVSLKIVIQYFQMYNHWRTMYNREIKRDLTFIEKDFEHPYTSDAIVNYFKSKYPDNFSGKCEIMLDMNPDELQKYIIRKEQFDNR